MFNLDPLDEKDSRRPFNTVFLFFFPETMFDIQAF